MTVVVRFAPAPTGKLHVGNVRAALWNWLFARKAGGKFILRIDDTDRERSLKENEDAIRSDLTWLNLHWDATFNQSHRFADYDRVADVLRARGLLYAAYETQEELERKRRVQGTRGLPPVYDRAGLHYTEEQLAAFKSAGRKPHWRFRLSQKPVHWLDLVRGDTTIDTANLSDPVLIREDGMYLYTLPSCVDDIDYGVTHVIRGEDHNTNTAVQIEIMQAVIEARGQGRLPSFAHFSLLADAGGDKLSKRIGSLSVETMRADGLEPAAIASFLAKLGTSEPIRPERDMTALAREFEFEKASRAPARFDLAELEALNAKVLHETPYTELSDRLGAIGVDESLWLAVRGNVAKVSEAARWKAVVDGPIAPVIEDAAFAAKAASLVPTGALHGESWSAFAEAVKRETGAKGKALFRPLRLALTGAENGPEMAAIFPLIGAERARARLLGERA
ncbi:MAG: glutamate--tRNA ligase [Parvularculaceae bacterium]